MDEPPALKLIRLCFAIKRIDGRFAVQLRRDSPQNDSLLEETFVSDCLTSRTQLSEKIANIARTLHPPPDDLEYVGSALFKSLTPGKIGEAFMAVREAATPDTQIQFRIDSNEKEMRHLPWEALYCKDIGFLVTNRRFCIVREPPIQAQWSVGKAEAISTLRILLVVPDGSNLSVQHERQNLEAQLAKLARPAQLQPLTGRVTVQRLKEVLDAQPWEIVHYIGHGYQEAGGKATIRLFNVDGNEDRPDGEAFAGCFRNAKVRLVLLNCCLGDAPSEQRSLSGLAPFLMQQGVPAVIALRYEISNKAATSLSQNFYDSLLRRERLGRVDLALDEARTVLKSTFRGDEGRAFIIPSLHVAPEYETLFLPSQDLLKEETIDAPSEQSFKLPPRLIKAVESRKCVVVLGPGILPSSAVRGAAGDDSLPGPLRLARQLPLKAQIPYPDPAQLEGADMMDESWQAELLARVCQFYQNSRGIGRAGLIEWLKELLKPEPLPEPVKFLRNWEVPLLFYCYIDGCLPSQATAPGAPRTVTLPRVSDKLVRGEADDRVLVLVRGTVNDDDSLVLTEHDNDELLRNIENLDPNITRLAKKEAGICTLFLGFHPRDPLARSLARKICETGENRKQGPTYFVYPQPIQCYEPYWKPYDIEAVQQRPEDVIQALTPCACSKLREKRGL